MNIFSVLGVSTREDVNTNMLIFALNNSESFRTHFLCKIDPGLICNSITWKAYPRISLSGIGVPDAVLVGKKENTCFLILVENKLAAEEGDEQTARYASQDCIKALATQFFKEAKEVYPHFLFLTLFPDIKAGSNNFQQMTHRELFCDYVVKTPDQLHEKLIADWQSILVPFYKREQLVAEAIISEMLQDDGGLDAGYLYFQKMMHEVNLQNGLLREWCWRDSRQGRKYYGARFTKGRWQTQELYKESDKWQFDGRNYDIHIEPQYNVLNGNLSVFLHYELCPYKTEKEARANIRQNYLTRYLEDRNKFITLLKDRSVAGCSMGGGWNQIAKLSIDLGIVTTKEAMESISNSFASISSAVDSVIAVLT